MNKLYLAILITFFVNLLVTAADSRGYIEQEIANIDKLIQEGKFVNGKIYFLNDTLEAGLLLFKGKNKTNYYLFCVCRMKDDSIRIFKAEEIKGYEINNEKYETHGVDGKEFFIHKIKSGKIDLYERKPLPFDNRFLYYIKFSSYNNLIVISPNENNFKVYQIANPNASGSSNATTDYYLSKGIDQKFKIFIKMYMSDCVKVTNMVNSDFYTIKDIPAIVETYNNCFY